MATTQIELKDLYDKNKYKVVNQKTDEKPGEIRCRRQRPVQPYVEDIKTAFTTMDEIVIMGAGKAVNIATIIQEVARHVQPKLHTVVTKGTEKHTFTFENVDDGDKKETVDRDVEYIRIRIIKDSKVSAADKAAEGYIAPVDVVTEETLAEAIKKAKVELYGRRSSGTRRPRRSSTKGTEESSPKTDEEKKARRPRRRTNNRKPAEKTEGTEAKSENRRRAPRRRAPRKAGETATATVAATA